MPDTALQSILVHRADLYERTAGDADAHGQPSIAYVASEGAVVCRLETTAGRAGARAPALTPYVAQTDEWLLYLEAGATVEKAWRVENVTLADGETVFEAGPFTVDGVVSAMGPDGKEHHIEVALRRVEALD